MSFNLNLYLDEKIDKDLLLIHDEYFVLITDDDPILYTGKSIYGNRIIGSIIEDLFDEKKLRYFHVLVSDISYQRLLRNHISLRELYADSVRLYIIDFTYEMAPISLYSIEYKDIPNNWLPLEESFVEDKNNEAQLSFSSSLKGGIADVHLSKMKSAVNFLNFTTELCSSILAPLGKSDYVIDPYFEPAKTGSFKIDLLLKIKPKSGKEFNFEFVDKVEQYFSSFIKFTFQNLKSATTDKIEQTTDFAELKNQLDKLIDKKSKKDKNEDVLINSIVKILKKSEDIDDFINNGISEMEFKSNNEELNDSDNFVATIDTSYFEKVKKYIPFYEEKIVEVAKEFTVRVYEINSESKKCKAFIKLDPKSNKLNIVYIKHNLLNFENSIYTKSLEAKSFIKIKGTSTLRNGRLSLIDVSKT
jgi:hypothetical protein